MAGTYTAGESQGIYAFGFDPATGNATEPRLAAETSNPSFLAISTDRRFLYAANENSKGTISAFSIAGAPSRLVPLNSVSSRGDSPCHLAVDRTGKWLAAANYNSGNITLFPIGSDGYLGEAPTELQLSGSSVNPERQNGPHAHEVVFSSDNRTIFVPDLGADRVAIYSFDDIRGTLERPRFVEAPSRGAGPRHLVFDARERFMYVVNELEASVTVFRRDREDFLAQQTISTLPDDFRGPRSAAEIAIHPQGTFLYASNRGHDSIALFSIDLSTGKLTARGHVSTLGKAPRAFAIAPGGEYLLAANQDSGTIVIFRIDPGTGGLTPSPHVVAAPAPASLVFS